MSLGTADNFSKYAAGIQSYVTVVAILVGGWWTLHTYGDLLTSQKAKADLDVANATIEKERREAASNRAVDLALTTETLAVGNTKHPERWVHAQAVFNNRSNEPIQLSFAEMQFQIARIDSVADNGMVTYGQPKDLRLNYLGRTLGGLTLRQGSSAQAVDAVQIVDQPGLYLVRIALPLSSKVGQVVHEYSAVSYVVVKE